MARVSSANIRSGPSRKTCYLRFVNNTMRKVNVIWIDYVGGNRYYGTLEPKRHFDIHTYEGHPWISEDSVTKKRMMLNNSEVFYPKSTSTSTLRPGPPRCYVPVLSNNELNGEQMKREYVSITLPVFSLVELSSEIIIKNVCKKEDISSLKLPKIIKARLCDEFFEH